jgi:methionine sulfoxide reductase catalytic subunit
MFIRKKRGWEIRGSETTPEAVFHDRRRLIQAAAAGSIAAVAAPLLGWAAAGRAAETVPDPTADLYPAKRNELYRLDRPVTDEKQVENYNNFYEFGTDKDIAEDAQALKIRPWTVTIDGLVEKPTTIAFDDLIRKMPLEERLYRHRCVEAWSMAVPWTGFPLKALVDFARPLGAAKYVQMQTFKDTSVASGQKQFWYPWPYTEGLTMAEAANDMTFMVTGAYGKPIAKSNGAPLRLATPWKYGFKSVKSIVKLSFTDKRPATFWEKLASVPHPRWSQASERVLGTGERRPTLIWNGYGEFVAAMYDGLQSEKLFV